MSFGFCSRVRCIERQSCLDHLFIRLIPNGCEDSWRTTAQLKNLSQPDKMGFVVKYMEQLADHVISRAQAENVIISSAGSESCEKIVFEPTKSKC